MGVSRVTDGVSWRQHSPGDLDLHPDPDSDRALGRLALHCPTALRRRLCLPEPSVGRGLGLYPRDERVRNLDFGVDRSLRLAGRGAGPGPLAARPGQCPGECRPDLSRAVGYYAARTVRDQYHQWGRLGRAAREWIQELRPL